MYVGLMGCDQGGFKDSRGRGRANIVHDGAIDMQHEKWIGGKFSPAHQRR
jgi:hypothetical protein